MTLHWIFGWEAFRNEQQAHGEPVVVAEYVTEMIRDTMENRQSGFRQLLKELEEKYPKK